MGGGYGGGRRACWEGGGRGGGREGGQMRGGQGGRRVGVARVLPAAGAVRGQGASLGMPAAGDAWRPAAPARPPPILLQS